MRGRHCVHGILVEALWLRRASIRQNLRLSMCRSVPARNFA